MPGPGRGPAGPGRAAWAELDVLCLTAMHKDPQRRYRTVEALARDVDHYLAGEPLEARPDSVRYRAGKFARRHWRALSAASRRSVVLPIPASPWTSSAALRPSRAASTMRPSRARSSSRPTSKESQSMDAPRSLRASHATA